MGEVEGIKQKAVPVMLINSLRQRWQTKSPQVTLAIL